jgi:hypothetical protein
MIVADCCKTAVVKRASGHWRLSLDPNMGGIEAKNAISCAPPERLELSTY